MLWLIHTLAIILYLHNFLIRGRLNATNRDLKFWLLWQSWEPIFQQVFYQWPNLLLILESPQSLLQICSSWLRSKMNRKKTASFWAISLAIGLKYRFNGQNLSGQSSDGEFTVIPRKPLEYSTTLLLFTFISHEKKKNGIVLSLKMHCQM